MVLKLHGLSGDSCIHSRRVASAGSILNLLAQGLVHALDFINPHGVGLLICSCASHQDHHDYYDALHEACCQW